MSRLEPGHPWFRLSPKGRPPGVGLSDCEVTTSTIQDSAVTTIKINNTAVTYAKIQDVAASRLLGRYDALSGTVQEIGLGLNLSFDTTNGELDAVAATVGDSGITDCELADCAVITRTINNNAVTAAKLGDSSVNDCALADCAVTTIKVNNNAITAAKLGDSSVNDCALADCSVTTIKINNNAITAAKLGDSSVSDCALADSAVVTAKINNTAVTYAKMQNVTASRLLGRHDTTSGSPQEIAVLGGLSFDTTNDALTADTAISDCTVATTMITDSAVTTVKVDGGAITNAKIADSSITLAKLLPGTTGNLITYDSTDGGAAAVATGTSGQVLTSNGANNVPTFQAASGGGTQQFYMPVVFSYMSADLDYWDQEVTGAGSLAEAQGGVRATSGATAGGGAALLRLIDSGTADLGGADPFDNNLVVQFHGGPVNGGGDNMYYFWTGNATPGDGGTNTAKHVGMVYDVAAGTPTLYGSNANGTTQTQTNIGASFSDITPPCWQTHHLKMASGTNVKFYAPDGTLAGTSTTNLPSGTGITGSNRLFKVGIENDAASTDSKIMGMGEMMLTWDAE